MINQVSSLTRATYTEAYSSTVKFQENAKSTNYTGVIYEPTNIYKKDNSVIIAKLKADSEIHVNQMKDLVKDMFEKQGYTLAGADQMWTLLSNGKFVPSEAAISQAKSDISPGGYWSVSQTSGRIYDFAISLSGSDDELMEKMREAVKNGFSEATQSWGQDLPELTTDTYDAVMEKFDNFFEKGAAV